MDKQKSFENAIKDVRESTKAAAYKGAVERMVFPIAAELAERGVNLTDADLER